jgi:hypothetical protein
MTMKNENLPIVGALKILADKTGSVDSEPVSLLVSWHWLNF